MTTPIEGQTMKVTAVAALITGIVGVLVSGGMTAWRADAGYRDTITALEVRQRDALTKATDENNAAIAEVSRLNEQRYVSRETWQAQLDAAITKATADLRVDIAHISEKQDNLQKTVDRLVPAHP